MLFVPYVFWHAFVRSFMSMMRMLRGCQASWDSRVRLLIPGLLLPTVYLYYTLSNSIISLIHESWRLEEAGFHLKKKKSYETSSHLFTELTLTPCKSSFRNCINRSVNTCSTCKNISVWTCKITKKSPYEQHLSSMLSSIRYSCIFLPLFPKPKINQP